MSKLGALAVAIVGSLILLHLGGRVKADWGMPLAIGMVIVIAVLTVARLCRPSSRPYRPQRDIEELLSRRPGFQNRQSGAAPDRRLPPWQ